MGTLEANPYDGSKYAVNYTIAPVVVGGSITAAKLLEIANTVNTERIRRGSAASVNTSVYAVGAIIQEPHIDTMVTALSTAATPYTDAFGGVALGADITAASVNAMINQVVNAGAVCLCNCNYCTCNCNYCTCNCDYACTCNCNYSDQRLKQDIKFLGIKNGFRLYSFKYIWDSKTTHVGVIAQEILKTAYKDAVSKDKDGFYMVDYSRLPI